MAEASHSTLIQRLWDEQRSPHCLLQISPSLGGPSQALGILCHGQTLPPHPLLLHWGGAPLDRAPRSTTEPQESSGEASSSERSLPQITLKSNKYCLISWKTSYKKLRERDQGSHPDNQHIVLQICLRNLKMKIWKLNKKRKKGTTFL